MDIQHPESIERVRVYDVAPFRRMVLGAFCALVYAAILPQVYQTMGQPRETAIAQLEEIEARKPVDSGPARVWVGGKLVNDAMLEDQVIGDEHELFGDSASSSSPSADGSVSGEGADDWRKAFEGTEIGSVEKELTDEEGRPLPSRYLPSAVSCAAIFFAVTLTALFFLLCRWLVWFKALTLFAPATEIKEGSFVLVQPLSHHGKAEITPVVKSKQTGMPCFVFQRQKYDLLRPLAHDYADMSEDCVGKGAENGAVRKVTCPIDYPVDYYAKSQGLSSEDVQQRIDLYGKNIVRVPTPKIFQLIKEQLLSPIVIFQVFCAILWMLDEYWQYTIFTLFSIVMFEATTAFQRLRTFSTLGSMASKPTPLQVYRDGKWSQLTTEDLLPGDLISFTRRAPAPPPGPRGKKQRITGGPDAPAANKKSAQATDAVPCDLIILSGSAVVNEATLTGESVPQMKDALKVDAHEKKSLNVDGAHRVHTLFSGTSVVVASPAAEDDNTAHPVKTPDGGCLCLVLRTGFSSSQGELMQMIEFSTQQVSADSKETGLALLVLLCFAIASAGYVLKKGLAKGDRTTHELLLKCVIIITSVVPRQLPMQMAMAVNTALMALMKNGIFCTEPFRVPFAGKISHCLFDKTGTLTTDQLVPMGVVNNMPGAVKAAAVRPMVDVNVARAEAALVLGACHSLVHMEGVGVVGDPIEIAALKGVEWSYDATTQVARPGQWNIAEKALEEEEKAVETLGATEKTAKEKAQVRVVELQKSIKVQKQRAADSPVSSVQILQRHHFNSELQRMSVVCSVNWKKEVPSSMADADSINGSERTWCFVKGSPEAIRELLTPELIPAWYDASYGAMAEEGMRVLALAYKPGNGLENAPRSQVESNLQFAGFIAFNCKTRSDSPIVIRALQESGHKVSMLTGDAPLTAYFVAKDVGLCRQTPKGKTNTTDCALALERRVDDEGECVGFEWVGVLAADKEQRVPFEPGKLKALAQKHDLVTLESNWEDAAESLGDEAGQRLWEEVGAISVLARCSPQGKAKVIRSLQAASHHNFVLMCGDGGNDVGALKQADVGVALLSGYGNTNTTGAAKPEDGEAKSAEDALNAQTKALEKRSSEAMSLRKTLMNKKQKELMSRQQEWLKEEMQARAERGEDTGVFGTIAAVKTVTQRIRAEMGKENQAISRKHGNVFDSSDDPKDPQADLMAGLDESMPIVRPGDASKAAPFTSRTPSVSCVVKLIRQGRCTLLSALQQQQIMMLECIISAYALSALSLEGARSSERQMMASGWLIMVASLAFSYTKHIEEMHPVRPLRSLFHPAIFLSMMGQAMIHVGCMWYGVKIATEAMGPELLKEVLTFHKMAKAKTLPEQQAADDDVWAELWMAWQTPFMPNLLNTVVFLVETSQMIAVLFVNYKGRPWMKGLLENHPLFLSVFLCVAGVAACAWGMSPELNNLIHLAPFPDDVFRWKVMTLVCLSLVGTFIWDRIITAIFAPKVFGAMCQEAKKTTFADLVPVFATAAKVAGGLFVLATGNILLLGAIGYYYFVIRKKQQKKIREHSLSNAIRFNGTSVRKACPDWRRRIDTTPALSMDFGRGCFN